MTASTSDLMPIEHIDDWDKRLARQDAAWDCEIIDRPVLHMSVGRPNPDYPPPAERQYDSLRERWFDTERVVEQAVHRSMNTLFLGDSLPSTYPNLGPEIFSAYFGQELEYGERTSWSIPFIDDWNDIDHVEFSRENSYYLKIEEMTEALLAAGKGKFYTGYTDLHPGGDCLAAFRDPQQLNFDMIENLDAVKAMLTHVEDVFLEVFDHYTNYLRSQGQAIATWPGIQSSKRWHVPSNDFSCMISNKMFEDVFLPDIARECRHAEASIYHLDGPDALRHLDALLEIPELNAIQWVYGAGNGRATDWLDVYKKCQAAGKGIQLGVGLDELDTIIDELKPEGVFLGVGVKSEEEADDVVRRVSKWR